MNGDEQPPLDYSIHYARFHDDTEVHADDMARHMTEVIGPCLPSDKRAAVLDLGCGYGFALRALRNLGYANVAGLEISSQQAARAIRAGFDVSITSDSAAWLAERRGIFDCVLMLDVLEHIAVEHQVAFLRAVHGAIRDGGRLVLTVPNANAILASRWRHIDFTHHTSYTEHSLVFVLMNAGFSNVTLEPPKSQPRFPLRLWKKDARRVARHWLVRWMWRQVFEAELSWEDTSRVSFELNLKAVAHKVSAAAKVASETVKS